MLSRIWPDTTRRHRPVLVARTVYRDTSRRERAPGAQILTVAWYSARKMSRSTRRVTYCTLKPTCLPSANLSASHGVVARSLRAKACGAADPSGLQCELGARNDRPIDTLGLHIPQRFSCELDHRFLAACSRLRPEALPVPCSVRPHASTGGLEPTPRPVVETKSPSLPVHDDLGVPHSEDTRLARKPPSTPPSKPSSLGDPQLGASAPSSVGENIWRPLQARHFDSVDSVVPCCAAMNL